MPVDEAIDELIDVVPELRGDRVVSELAGGLTNTNYKVATDARRLRRAHLGQGLRHARDRPRKRVPEHRRRRRRGRRRGRRRLPAGAFADGARVHRGPDAERRGPAPRGQARDGRATPAGGCTAPRRFRDDFNMFDIQRRYLALVQERGFRLPDRYLEFEPAGARDRACDGGARRGHRALQQRPAGRELHRHRRRVPADRLRVLRQQRRLLRARQRLERVEPVARPARRAGRPLLRPAAAPTRWRGRGCGA